jgi:peptidoglycan/LPS O-acetylase OafA/YrhL
MNQALSVYLDLVRYCAALVVFLGHASGRLWTGGLLWQFDPYMQTAVIVFFVLSGFVIAYVVATRERDAADYTASRLARLWSVALPALALTFAIDYVGLRVAPSIYVDRTWYHGDDLWLRYVTSAFFVHELWSAGLVPGTNGPYWSIGYEAAYYLFFGLLVFVRQKLAAALLLIAAMALAGPTIVAMFPLWLLGVAAYYIVERRRPNVIVSLPLLAASTAVLAMSPALRQATASFSVGWISRNAFVGDYIDGIAFFLHLVAASRASELVGPLLTRHRRIVSWLATGTFALYLFHRPLIQFFAYVGPEPADGWPRRILVFLGVPATVIILTPLTERFKRYLKRSIVRILRRGQVDVATPVRTNADADGSRPVS